MKQFEISKHLAEWLGHKVVDAGQGVYIQALKALSGCGSAEHCLVSRVRLCGSMRPTATNTHRSTTKT